MAQGAPIFPGNEWATINGRTKSWLLLTLSSPQTLDHVVLYDRPNVYDQIVDSTLTFSDGSIVKTGKLANNGYATTVRFTPRSTSSVKLTVTKVSGTTYQVGLSEIELWTSPPPPPAPMSAAVASFQPVMTPSEQVTLPDQAVMAQMGDPGRSEGGTGRVWRGMPPVTLPSPAANR